MAYTKEALLELIEKFEKKHNKLPSRRDIWSEFRVGDSPFTRLFGSWSAALLRYQQSSWSAALLIPQQKPVKGVEEAPKNQSSGLLEELGRNVTEQELRALVESSRKSTVHTIPKLPVAHSGHFKALIIGDTHIGHKKFNERWWFDMLTHAVAEGCEFAWHTGDILEGMSGRPGHVYELDQIGFETQFDKARQLLSDCPFPVRGITGNHDLWYQGKGDIGVNVGVRLQEALPDKFVFLGDMEADEEIAGLKIKLWHGLDGAAYSTSYRTQKFVEALSSNDKPHILLSGHAHKAIYHECRNVQVFETGTLCSQTGFMRGKKLAAHTGYWIIEVWAGEQGLTRIRPEWNTLI